MGTTLTLHIGQLKTGTTSLQKALAAHPEVLEAAGVNYPLTPGRDSFGAEVSDLHLLLGTPQAVQRTEGRRLRARAESGAWERLVANIHKSDGPVLVSAESLYSLPGRAAQYVVETLFGSQPDNVRVVAQPAVSLIRDGIIHRFLRDGLSHPGKHNERIENSCVHVPREVHCHDK